mmetsp:Transcript_33127/g.53728  ORF Transcript_33127/g.53728 Transcript_33127/m.53728 type:complete len:84 (-) Transcript_33127:225-476(-)
MTRGNQRDKDRERAQARKDKVAPKNGREDGATASLRKEKDAESMREKQKKADEKRQEEDVKKKVLEASVKVVKQKLELKPVDN